MKTIAIMNVKGGVGKTMTACNMAHILTDTYRQRVLLIDADPQANASEFFDVKAENFCDGLTGLLQENWNEEHYERFIAHTAFEGVDLLPADSSLFDIDLKPGEGAQTAISNLCELLHREDMYDIVLIDCPPSFTVSAISALRAADSVIVPVKMDAFSFRGMEFLFDELTAVHKINGRVRLEGVLVTLWHNCVNNVQAENLLRNDYGIRVFSTHIRRSDKADESTWYRSPVCEYSRYSAVARDYRDFVAEFVKLGGLKNGTV